jgi:hypothetical protein
MANKKMTIKYWKTLSRGSKYRALCFVFGPHQCLANIYADEKPNLKDGMWKLIFKKIHIPEDHSHYKTCVNQTYIP